MKNEFYVLKDSEGILRPRAFISRKNDEGEYDKKSYEKKLEDGEQIVVVELIEKQ